MDQERPDVPEAARILKRRKSRYEREGERPAMVAWVLGGTAIVG